jgi:DNA-binding CsgD family transcriptional regulator
MIPQGAVLTHQQRAVVERLTSGLTVKETASDLGVSQKTVEYHWTKAREIVGIQDLARMTHWAIATDIIPVLYEVSLVQITPQFNTTTNEKSARIQIQGPPHQENIQIQGPPHQENNR